MPPAGRAVRHRRGQPRHRRSRARFHDLALFTHRGLSGPAILQISISGIRGRNHRRSGPGTDIAAGLREAQGQGGRIAISTALWALAARGWPMRSPPIAACKARGWADQGNAVPDRVGARVNRWSLRPVGSEGWRTAEVTLGGVDTRRA